MSHTKEDLKELQSKSLEEKIQISTARIIEWYEHWDGKVAVSFSGGKDSTVLLDLVRNVYPDVIAVYSDTGLEFPEIRTFVKSFDNVAIVKPKLTFGEVVTKFGYPVISKQCSRMIWDLQNPSERNIKTRNLRLTGITSTGKKATTKMLPLKWRYLSNCDVPIGDNCCNKMKKEPLKHYYHKTGLHPMTAVMTVESERREQNWLQQGCNAFNLKEPISTPLAFWTEQDILHYIKKYNLPYASVYGELKETNGLLYFTNYKRTGCVFCGFGCHLEKEPNRFQTLAHTHPQLYDYCMRGGKYDESTGMWIPDKGLGMAKVLDYINVKWWNDGDEAKRDEYRAKYKEKEEIEQSRKKSSQTD